MRLLLATLLLLLRGAASAAASPPILIQGGTVVNADHSFRADVLISDGVIQRVSPTSLAAPPGATVLNATGLLVMPGGIDPHTHLEMPFMGQVACDDFFSGQAAALAGGTTMHIDFALPIDHDLDAGLAEWHRKAAKSCMDYGFHLAITAWQPGTAAAMARAVAGGVNSFKFFLAYKGALMVDDAAFLAGLAACKSLGALAQVHAENGDAVAVGQAAVVAAGITAPHGHALSRPAVLEGEATARAIRLAAFVNTPLYVVHVMSREAAEEVARARTAGQRVVGEPVASGLALEESAMWHPEFDVAARYVMSPPIRGREHGAFLRGALAGGVLSLVATDHAVFNSTQKAAGVGDFRLIPNGVNGIEERLHVVWQEMVVSGLMGRSDFVRVTSTAAAQTFNIYPRKGVIAPGSDADVILFDPEQEYVIRAAHHHSRMDSNVYEGRRVKGMVVSTISRGRLVWHEGRLDVEPGTGRFVEMPAWGPLFEGLQAAEDRASAERFADAERTCASGEGYLPGGATV